jgi:hypothetical protein
VSKKGYIANLLAVPPLIFKFQFHPEMLSEKKGFEYHDDVDLGKWEFARTSAGARRAGGLAGKIAPVALGFARDVPHFGPLLVGTKAMRPVGGRARTFALEFALDARPKPGDPTAVNPDGEERRIEPDLAVLRSFVNPGFDALSDIPALFDREPIWKKPPTCDLKLGDVELTCVMNDLNIKITKFRPDLTPERAEVSVTLSEQTRSLSTVIDVMTRNVQVVKSWRNLTQDDVLQQVPGYGFVQDAFD